ncbi:Glycopeptide antibiotics resistance protein [Gracilibacillus ureilyticus]|uniref:Glycopeptide antibiotics resistance protein n=1 Tax=Gracilibacillus ureilyticus TaxID=531814 RepID=A0A1H9VAR4_9BACI|nr:VanZ family protein [Gracilibacillus ureilyticus]SES18668.1 Glycopeptide antibiotics resistance protein [Gracilibacillus ureilyticus]
MKKAIKFIFSISFIFYAFVLAVLLFLNRVGGMWSTELSLLETIRFNSNFVPFKTISTYIQAFLDGSMNADIPIKNLFGNLFMFLPMGIYLPFFINKANKLRIFTVLMTTVLLFIETIQLVTRRGSFDIDDFILNIIGAFIGLGIWKTKIVQRILK